MKFTEFKENLQEIYASHLPHSMVSVEEYHGLGKSITIRCYVAGKKDEFAFGIAQNDLLSVLIDIVLPDYFDFENDDLPENMKPNKLESSYLLVPEVSYMAYGRRKISARIPGGNAEKCLKSFDKYIGKVVEMLKEDYAAGKIPQDKRALLEKKL